MSFPPVEITRWPLFEADNMETQHDDVDDNDDYDHDNQDDHDDYDDDDDMQVLGVRETNWCFQGIAYVLHLRIPNKPQYLRIPQKTMNNLRIPQKPQ